MKETITKVMRVLCVLLVVFALVLLSRLIINKAFLHDYGNRSYREMPEASLQYMPLGENYIDPYNLGNVKYKKADYDSAIRYYNKALKLNPTEEDECKIRINLALAMCHKIKFNEIDKKDANSVQIAIDQLKKARNVLTEKGCASEGVMTDDGHSKDAEKLKHDIDAKIMELEASQQNPEDDPNKDKNSGGDANKDKDKASDGDANKDKDNSQGNDKKDQDKYGEDGKYGKKQQDDLKDKLEKQEDDLKSGRTSDDDSDYRYIDGGEISGFGDGTQW